MATRGSIKYRKLNQAKREIRLLELLPAHETTAPVSCRLITIPLTDDLEYLALSSLYGDHNDTARIVVDDQQVLITAHLAQALKHIRTVFFPSLLERQQEQAAAAEQLQQQQQRELQEQREQRRKRQGGGRAPRWLLSLLRGVSSILPSPELESTTPLRLWVDVLCINQADDDEKSRQRSNMATIYASAKMVIGWLGLKGPLTDAGLKILHDIDDAMPRHWGDPGDEQAHPDNYAPRHEWAKSVSHVWADRESDGAMASYTDHWIGATDFMTRPYFQRRWILEEISMARYPTFLIGDEIVSWKLVLRVNRFMEEFKETESNVFPAKLRASIAELPLGTIHALLDEFAKRRSEEDEDSLHTSRTSEHTKSTVSTHSKQDSKQDSKHDSKQDSKQDIAKNGNKK